MRRKSSIPGICLMDNTGLFLEPYTLHSDGSSAHSMYITQMLATKNHAFWGCSVQSLFTSANILLRKVVIKINGVKVKQPWQQQCDKKSVAVQVWKHEWYKTDVCDWFNFVRHVAKFTVSFIDTFEQNKQERDTNTFLSGFSLQLFQHLLLWLEGQKRDAVSDVIFWNPFDYYDVQLHHSNGVAEQFETCLLCVCRSTLLMLK